MEKNKNIGMVRLEYLDTATKLINTDLSATLQYIDNFLITIQDGHEATTEIQKAFDKAIIKKNNTLKNLEEETEKLNLWERAEQRANGKAYAELQEINDRLNSCWQIAMRHGLFHE